MAKNKNAQDMQDTQETVVGAGVITGDAANAAATADAVKKPKKESEAHKKAVEEASKVIQGLIATDIPEYGGIEDIGAELEQGKLYWVDLSMLNLDAVANGRLYYAEEAMEHALITDGRVHTPLLGEVPPGTTFNDLLDRVVSIDVLQGHRRTMGVSRVRSNPQMGEFYAKNFEARIPIIFAIGITESQRQILRKDQTSQRGLEQPEVMLQVIQLIKQGYSERDCIERLFDLFYRSATDTRKYDETLIRYKQGQATSLELWKSKHSMCHGRWQTAYAFAQIPDEIFKHYAAQMMPRYAAQINYVVDARITTEQVRELGSMMMDGIKAKKNIKEIREAILVRFNAMLKAYRDRKNPTQGGEGGEDGEGGGEDSGPVGKSFSKADINKILGMYESDTFQTVLKGCAGDADCRKRWPEMDADLARYEQALSSAPDLMRKILTDPTAFREECVGRGIEL